MLQLPNAGGLLGDSGTIGSTTVNAGGTIQPGAPFVTLNVAGTFTQNVGSTYAPMINAAPLTRMNRSRCS